VQPLTLFFLKIKIRKMVSLKSCIITSLKARWVTNIFMGGTTNNLPGVLILVISTQVHMVWSRNVASIYAAIFLLYTKETGLTIDFLEQIILRHLLKEEIMLALTHKIFKSSRKLTTLLRMCI
jgi:hypothetical protein